MTQELNRRRFLAGAAATGALMATAGLQGCATLGPRRVVSANERLNVGIIGVANRGNDNLRGVVETGENIVALCDIDANYLARAKQRFPRADTYRDYRKMLERTDLDAVVVSTPDHVHAFATMRAIDRGLHVYCEKPLCHSVHEARAVAVAARRAGVATQMGTQIHAQENYRRVVEVVRSGAIGRVTDVHVWVGKTWSGGERPTERPPVPGHIDWDLWLGPAPHRPYHPTYLPANWRRWWDFGTGTLGDMACHYMDLPFWALELEYPDTIEAIGGPLDPETTPSGLRVRYTFPQRWFDPAINLTWYDTDQVPAELKEHGLPAWGSGVLFIGDKGMLMADYDRYRLYPEADFESYEPPEPSIPKSVGHYQEWVNACKTGSPTTCDFTYSGRLTESVLLGNVAYRAGQKIEWNHRRLLARGLPEVAPLILREYRTGWSLGPLEERAVAEPARMEKARTSRS